MENARRAASTSHIWGYVLVLSGAACFISTMYMMVFSKLLLLLDDSSIVKDGLEEGVKGASVAGGGFLEAVERDVYYCYLVPLTIPVTVLAFYANWVSLKFFRHN